MCFFATLPYKTTQQSDLKPIRSYLRLKKRLKAKFILNIMKALMNYNLFFSIEKTPWKTIHEPQTKVAGERKVCPEYEIFKFAISQPKTMKTFTQPYAKH